MEKDKNNFERRSDARFDIALPLKISGQDYDLITNTKNISCSGIYCQVSRYIPVMTKLALTMHIPLIIGRRKVEKKVDCACVVVRIMPEFVQESVNDYHLGLFFSQIQEKDKALISKYIQQAFFAGLN